LRFTQYTVQLQKIFCFTQVASTCRKRRPQG
jgi:hypothetical protein